MLLTTDHSYRRWVELALLGLLLLLSIIALSTRVYGQGQRKGPAAHALPAKQAAEQPLFRDYKGVSLGVIMDQVRQKLGEPMQKSDEMDMYVFSQTEIAQVYYDQSHQVKAISIDYLGGAGAPAFATVVGGQPETKADGSIYKLVRYPQAGCWVSYNRAAGAGATVTVTIQKM